MVLFIFRLALFLIKVQTDTCMISMIKIYKKWNKCLQRDGGMIKVDDVPVVSVCPSVLRTICLAKAGHTCEEFIPSEADGPTWLALLPSLAAAVIAVLGGGAYIETS